MGTPPCGEESRNPHPKWAACHHAAMPAPSHAPPAASADRLRREGQPLSAERQQAGAAPGWLPRLPPASG